MASTSRDTTTSVSGNGAQMDAVMPDQSGQDVQPEAGPSRPRASSASSSSSSQHPESSSHVAAASATVTSTRTHRPASPDSALPPDSTTTASTTPARPATPHMDLATYPTPDLLRLLASLLQQIALANDQLRPDFDDLPSAEDEEAMTAAGEEGSSRSGSRASSHPSHHPVPSPTTALFSSEQDQNSGTSSSSSTTRGNGREADRSEEWGPLFTASKTSLSYPSSLLSFHARHIPSISIEAYLLRILKYCPTTNEVFLGLLVYFDRMSRLGTPSGVGGESAGARRGIGRGFAIDSYNIHRLIIAGVTVASKFFSDVFYTNSRYAKVGGLPPHELNQLELQFLLLNDFRLVIPCEEMQRYGDRLLGFWQGQDLVNSGGEAKPRVAVPDPTPDASSSHVSQSSTNDPATLTRKETQGGQHKQQSDDRMDVDPPAGSDTRAQPPNPAPQAAPPPHASSVHFDSTNIAPRGKERDTTSSEHGRDRERERDKDKEQPKEGVRERAVNFATDPNPRKSATPLRDWVRTGGEDVMGGVINGGRMTSPMRD